MTGGALATTLPATRPVLGNVTATSASGTSVRVATGANGAFTIQLPPGTYSVTATSPVYDSGMTICATNGGAVSVSSGHRTTVLVSCDEH